MAERFDAEAVEILRRVIEGIPPCQVCTNTHPDWWAIDVYSAAGVIEECLVCGHRRPLIGGIEITEVRH